MKGKLVNFVAETAQPRESVIVAKAALAAASRLGLPAKTLARVIGMSEPTVSRLKGGAMTLRKGTKAFELAVLFVRMFRSLDAITGGDETVARAWLANRNVVFGEAPLDRITTIAGLIDVIDYLDARRAVV